MTRNCGLVTAVCKKVGSRNDLPFLEENITIN